MILTPQSDPTIELWESHHHAPVPPVSLRRWVLHCSGLCLPDRVHWCDGTDAELELLRSQVQATASAVPDRRSDALAATAKPASKIKLQKLFHQSMRGRTMFVVPFIVCASESFQGIVGVQLTDSAGATLSMRLTWPTTDTLWNQIAVTEAPLHCLHSRGVDEVIEPHVHFFSRGTTVWVYGPGYNAPLLRRVMRPSISAVATPIIATT